MPEVYYKSITNKNASAKETQGILERRNKLLDELVKKDMLISSLDSLFMLKSGKLRIKQNFVGRLNEYSMISNWEKYVDEFVKKVIIFCRFFKVKNLSYLFICNKGKQGFKSYAPMNYVNFVEESLSSFCEYRLSQTLFLKSLMKVGFPISDLTEYINKYLIIKLIWTSKFLLQIKIGFRNCNYREEK